MHFIHSRITVTSLMRIIAGEFRGRRLLGPPDHATRPITDRVKQSLFDVLRSRLEGAAIYDIFSGTGSLGLEAMSRGADSCVFFERHRPALLRLQRNIDALGLAGRCRIISGDVLKLGQEDLAALPPADVAFVDPPYPLVQDRADELRGALAMFSARLHSEGVIVLRLRKGEVFDPALPLAEERAWGSMRVLMLSRTGG